MRNGRGKKIKVTAVWFENMILWKRKVHPKDVSACDLHCFIKKIITDTLEFVIGNIMTLILKLQSDRWCHNNHAIYWGCQEVHVPWRNMRDVVCRSPHTSGTCHGLHMSDLCGYGSLNLQGSRSLEYFSFTTKEKHTQCLKNKYKYLKRWRSLISPTLRICIPMSLTPTIG